MTPFFPSDRVVRFAQSVFAGLLLVRIYMDFALPPIGDEAYYWMWGQKLGWSYFDHPPLHAWLLGLMGLLFGWNLFSLRVLTWLTLGGTLWLFWLWCRRLNPANPHRTFWITAAIYLASPLFFFMTTIAFHDHLLILLSLATTQMFLVFAERWERDGRSFKWLYAAAVLLGLAILTKYNGALIGLGILVFCLSRRELRPLFRTPHLYLAGGLAVAMQAPVLWWNLTEGFASYRFHLSERWGGTPTHIDPLNVLYFLGYAVVTVSPFLFPPIVRLIRRGMEPPPPTPVRQLALAIFFASSAVMLLLSLFVRVFFYWNIIAFLPLIPLLALSFKRTWVLVGHLCFGVAAALLIAFNFTVLPVGNLIGAYDWTVSSMFGWPQVAARIEDLRKQHQVGFIAATRYTTAAQLGYALHDSEVTALSPRHDQYDYWFDKSAHAGENALIVSDPNFRTRDFSTSFKSVTKLESVSIIRFGQPVYTPDIYLGEGYIPQ